MGYCPRGASEDVLLPVMLSYDQENRLTGASGYTYTYDVDGNRVKKSNGSIGTLYWYMTPGIVGESDLSGNLTAEYVFFDGERVARKDFPGNAVSYYFSDHLKTASVITDSAGNIKAESDYYPWGGELQFTNNDSTAQTNAPASTATSTATGAPASTSQSGLVSTTNTSANTGTVYVVPGSGTKSGKPYVGRHNKPNPAKTRRSNDGRDRSQAKVVDKYPADDTQAGRVAEQKQIDKNGGVENLDNMRNEIKKPI